MSVPSIEFIKTDDLIVKEECNIELEFVKQMQTNGVGLLGVPENRSKCGEVFISDEKTFILMCAICEELYASMLDFGEHYMEQHVKVEEILHECGIDEDTVEVNNEEALTPEPLDGIVKLPLMSVELLEETNDPVTNAIVETLPEIEVQKIEVENDGDEYNESDRNFANDLDYSEEDSDVGSGSDYKPLKRKHNKATKNSAPRLFCELCERQFKSAITFNRHVNKVHDQNKRKPYSLKCRYCDREFPTEKELNEHKNTHDRLRPFQCPQCPKSFTSSNHRQKHINMHMGVRPYKCSKCPSAFGTECNLRQHMLTHAVAGPLSCDICGKQFIHQSRKDVHMRSHTGEKPFQCELCGRKFIIRSRLTEHMKRHNNTRNHECEICGKKFYTNVMLKHHQVAHSSDRPFECSECGKTFPRKLSLKMHRKIHLEVKQYSCNICGKEFRQYAGLYAHRKSHGEKKGLPQTNIAISDKFTPPTHLLVVRDEESANETT